MDVIFHLLHLQYLLWQDLQNFVGTIFATFVVTIFATLFCDNICNIMLWEDLQRIQKLVVVNFEILLNLVMTTFRGCNILLFVGQVIAIIISLNLIATFFFTNN